MIVRHPLFPEVQRDVRDPAKWVQAGWVPVPPPCRRDLSPSRAAVSSGTNNPFSSDPIRGRFFYALGDMTWLCLVLWLAFR